MDKKKCDDRILAIRQDTKERFLNFFTLKIKNRVGTTAPYYVSSRAKTVDELKLVTRENKADGVIIYSLYGHKADKLVVIRQYRYAIGDYIYELPAGLVDDAEGLASCAVRELKEETGLDFYPIETEECYNKPFFSTIGMTDESVSTIFGYADGEISEAGLEDTEDIQTMIIDKEEAKRILKEENVALPCAFLLMHFIASEEGKPFAFVGK